METDFIKTELQKFNIADAVISKMSAEYMPLKVKSIADKEGLKKVHDARIVIRDIRIEVEKKRKKLKESSLRFGQSVDSEAKRITGLLKPIESHLENEEGIIEREKERLRLAAEEESQKKLQARVERLKIYNYTMYLMDVVKNMTDVEFDAEAEKARIAYEFEQLRLIDESKQKQIEAALLEKIKAEQAAESKRLADIAKQQIEAENKINAEQKKIEDEKRLIVEAKLRIEQIAIANKKLEAEKERQAEVARKHLVDIENAKQEAAEKAKIEIELKIKREAEEKLEAERQAVIEAKRQEALKPDKEKLLHFAATLTALEMPVFSNQKATNVANRAIKALANIIEFIQMESNKL